MYTQLSAPVNVQWEVTPLCNYNCIHCYNYWRKEGEEKTPNPDIDAAIVDEIIQNHIFTVTITGGEPLIVWSRILPSLKRLTEAGVEVSMNSNLSLLTEDMAATLKEIGVNSILTSLPSSDEITNGRITQSRSSKERTTRGIRLALSAGLHVGVNMTVTRLNLTDIYSTAEYVKSLGVKSFSATKAAIPGNCKDFSPYQISPGEFRWMLNELVRVKHNLGMKVDSLEFYPPCSFGDEITRQMFGTKRSCTAGKTSCTIGYDGQIRPCSHAPQTYGTITDGLKTAWDNMEEWREEKWIPDECQACHLKLHCGGGCKVEALMSAGAMNQPDPYCDFRHSPIPVHAKVGKVNLDNPYSIQTNLKFRQESFGGIIYSGNLHWLAVTADLFEYLKQHSGDQVIPNHTGGVFGQSEKEKQESIHTLLKKKIIQRVEI